LTSPSADRGPSSNGTESRVQLRVGGSRGTSASPRGANPIAAAQKSAAMCHERKSLLSLIEFVSVHRVRAYQLACLSAGEAHVTESPDSRATIAVPQACLLPFLLLLDVHSSRLTKTGDGVRFTAYNPARVHSLESFPPVFQNCRVVAPGGRRFHKRVKWMCLSRRHDVAAIHCHHSY